MARRRTEVELAVERDATGPDGIVRRYRLTARLPLTGTEEAVPAAELRELYQQLAKELEAGLPVESRADRSAAELVETYHPRQRELLDLLLAEKEITETEFARLKAYLEPPTTPPPPEVPAETDRPIAAAPLAVDRAPSSARPVEQLLQGYQIESLKQAGAVRARRQISYEEYMALKRHFSRPAEPSASATTSDSPPA
jgi:hypothetical protein